MEETKSKGRRRAAKAQRTTGETKSHQS
uniref:Troponin T n=1 Tax=Dolomedes sulfureus TaxID=492288 RepID=A0A0P0DQJ0_9ARAC|nr:troponin T [Dolomedes sulfureus]